MRYVEQLFFKCVKRREQFLKGLLFQNIQSSYLYIIISLNIYVYVRHLYSMMYKVIKYELIISNVTKIY